jgi:acyl dehydratase
LYPKRSRPAENLALCRKIPLLSRAAPYVLGGDAVEREMPAEQLFDELKSLKEPRRRGHPGSRRTSERRDILAAPRENRSGRDSCHAGPVSRANEEVASRTRRVSARDIELFTELTGDRNPLHYDEAAARDSRFGGLIVQGGITSGLLNAVVAEDLPGPGSVFLHVEWDFKAPVRPGDEITAEVEVLEAREDKPITKLRTTVTNQDGTVVLDGTALVWTEPI